jgi:hypothetical protein
VVRWTLTSRYAAKIGSRQEEQVEGEEPTLGLELSQGIKAWTGDIDTSWKGWICDGDGETSWKVDNFTSEDPDFRQHDYFLRLSDGEKCIWEGFVPLVPTDKGPRWRRSHEYMCYTPAAFDLGTLWEEEGFHWYKEVRDIFESHPAFQTYQKLNRTNQRQAVIDQAAEAADLLKGLDNLMSFILENKCFTFVAVERDLPLTRQFIPKVFVTTKGITPCRSIFDPFWFMNDRRVFPAIEDIRTILMTRFLPESFIFKFHLHDDYGDLHDDYGDISTWGSSSTWSSSEEEEEEEQIKKSNEIPTSIYLNHDDDIEIVAPKRALTFWYKERVSKRAKKKLGRKNRKKQEPHKKNTRRQTKRGELIA